MDTWVDRLKIGSGGRRLIVAAAHVTLWSGGFVGAYLLRFDGVVPPEERTRAAYGLAALLAIRVGTFWASGLFHGIMKYAGIPEVKSIVRATTIGTILLVSLGVVVRSTLLPRSIYVGEWVIATLSASGLRLAVRVLRERSRPALLAGKRALLIGAGDAGEMFLRDLQRVKNPGMVVVGILDDDPAMHEASVRGVRVLGPVTERALRRAKEDHEATLAVLAIPSASGARTREIVSACRDIGLETKTLPGLQQILTGDVKVSMLRDVAIEDLLRREPIELDRASMAKLLRGKRVLVTGGAGSIGSELARQALRYEPAALGLLDHDENALFFLERELRAAFPRMELEPFVADVRDPNRISQVLRAFRPHATFHAAAHKHVPLMEANPAEAVKNNVFGTRVVADLCNAFGVETFVMVSTDKAVNPTSVMGCTKRVAEMYVQSLATRARTRFVTVRFGNVLGSAGSVVQIFREQIAAGGPVTVTHPDMRRYFMTIPEACQLVLQAGALAQGGEIFVLDMGEPVKIVDLARDMIRMSGYEPDSEIKVQFTGVRPGEKLFEELMLDGESHDRTVHPKILVGRTPPVSAQGIDDALAALAAVTDAEPLDIRRALSSIVPEARLGGVAVPSDVPPEVDAVLRELETFETLRAGTA